LLSIPHHWPKIIAILLDFRPKQSVDGCDAGQAGPVKPEPRFGLCPVRAPDWLAPITEAMMVKTKKANSKAGSAFVKSKSKDRPTDSKSTKSNAILNLLRRKQGASLEEIQKASGWQIHSVRGYLSGTVKKRLGLTLNSSKSPNGERRYTIAAG
jgi:hypothetical protein